MEMGAACVAPTLDDLNKEPGEFWIEPISDTDALPSDANPAEHAILKESIRLAFVSALQRLPAKQRAAFLLNDVLDFSSAETAAALDLSVASVNSALQRARDTLGRSTTTPHPQELSALQQATVSAYVDAFERYDIPALTSLLRADVTLSMPPYTLWLRGPASISDWMLGLGSGCRGSRLRPTAACGSPAFAQYRPGSANGHEAWALIVLELAGQQISGLNTFLDVEHLFPKFGLPLILAP
jgi:RNA polymerase sigma-70 factor (ECF subfamily)